MLAVSEELNDFSLLVDALTKKHPDNHDDILDFLNGLLAARYENPARAVFQAETMKFMVMVRNVSAVTQAEGFLPFLRSFMELLKKGGKDPLEDEEP